MYIITLVYKENSIIIFVTNTSSHRRLDKGVLVHILVTSVTEQWTIWHYCPISNIRCFVKPFSASLVAVEVQHAKDAKNGGTASGWKKRRTWEKSTRGLR